MEKCKYYVNHPWADRYGYCAKTENRDLCLCCGDKSKCDFCFRKEKKMTTFEMMIEARANGKTYRANDLLYNTERGFHDKFGREWEGRAFDYLNELFEIDKWQLDNTIYMTKSEAEEKYGIKIVGR